MKIKFERTGGFTAIPMRLALDTDQLEPALAAELVRLVGESQLQSMPEVIESPVGTPDQFHYHLTVEHEGSSHTVETGDVSSPETLRPLLRQLTLMARSSRTAT